MSRRRPRDLHPEEQELWQRVARTAAPLHQGLAPMTKAVEAAPGPATRQPVAKPHLPLESFRIGARSMQTARLDLAPTVGERLAAQPLAMDGKTHGRMTRGKLAPEARIDLHGMTLAEAHPELTHFILSCHEAGRRLVLVITGKGRLGADDGPIPQRPGVLKRQVPQWLGMPPLGAMVLQVTEAHLRHGGAGAYYVYLRRAR